ncbi:MAG: LPS-assembly protein LptD [Ferruginibacter sp.]|nr:LPS-assembly protein LptD [Ferruginibacter sp.]
MSDSNKGKANYILAWLCVLPFIILTYCSIGSGLHNRIFHIPLTADTVPPVKKELLPEERMDLPARRVVPAVNRRDTIPRKDSTKIVTVDSFNIKSSRDSLSAPVVYHADDSMVFDVPGKKLLLYGKKSSIKYNTQELSAPQIEYDNNTNLVKAFLKRDSTGSVISFPSFNDGEMKTISDSITVNLKTGRGITKGTYTQQGEMFVYGEKIKRADENVFYALNGRFTTCNLDTPHFAFISHKIKFINQKMAFSGPVHPEFEGVPVPIVLPFGIYPLSQGRHSGFIAPSFTANAQLGLALDGLGYYKILSPNWDIITRGTLYSYGGWNVNMNPRYFRRYRYQGNLSLEVQRYKPLDVPSNKSYNFSWTHQADTKSRPGVTFTASVLVGSSAFNSQVPNDPRRNFQNSLNSSIAYSKTWKDRPYNVALTARHSQNTNTKLFNIFLPDGIFNLNTLYPFRRKEPIGEYKWYENLGVALNTNASSRSSFYDTAGHIGQQLIDRLQWGATHNVPITLSLPQIGPVQIAPGISYQEKWYQQRSFRTWNPVTKKVDTTINKGFYTARDMSFSLSANTRIFGMLTFNKSSKVQAIRHEIRPSVGISYKPDLNKNSYRRTQVDTARNFADYSIYDGGIYGPFGQGRFGGLTFSLDNMVSMKVRNRKDTSAGAVKKVSILDGLRLDGSYNFLKDSFRMEPLSLSARSNLFDKVNITASAVFDPYQTNAAGQRIDKLVWAKNPLSLGALTSGQLSLQSQFTGGDKKSGATPDVNTPRNVDASGMPLDEYQRDAAYIRNNPGEFVDFSIPWSINFNYTLTVYRNRRFNEPGFTSKLDQSVSWDGSVNMTPKWKVGITGSYNIGDAQVNYVSMYLSREMHCWQMSINIAPVGIFRSFSINISPKSPILRDLKINRTRQFVNM